MTHRRITVTILIVLGLALGAAAVWRGSARPAARTTSPPEASPASQASASLPLLTYAEPSGDWTVFASTGLGFSVQHPSDWTVIPCGAGCVAFSASGSAEPVLGISVLAGTLDSLVTRIAPYIVASDSVQFGPVSWQRVTMRVPQTGAVMTSHLSSNNGTVIEFGAGSTTPDILEVYGSMVSSFRFI